MRSEDAVRRLSGTTPSLSIDEARSKIAAWRVDHSMQRISS